MTPSGIDSETARLVALPQSPFIIISRLILLRITNVLDEFVEKIKTHVLCPIVCIVSKNCALYEIMRNNIAQSEMKQMRI